MNKHSDLNHNAMVPLSTPGTATTGRVNSDWISLAHGSGVKIEVIVTEGRAAAADDNTLTFLQATTASGGSSKAFVPRRAYRRADGTSMQDAAAATRVEVDASDMHIDGDMTTIYEVEIDASELDVNNDFKFIRASLAGVGGSTTTATIIGRAIDLRHAVDPVQIPDVLA